MTRFVASFGELVACLSYIVLVCCPQPFTIPCTIYYPNNPTTFTIPNTTYPPDNLTPFIIPLLCNTLNYPQSCKQLPHSLLIQRTHCCPLHHLLSPAPFICPTNAAPATTTSPINNNPHPITILTIYNIIFHNDLLSITPSIIHLPSLMHHLLSPRTRFTFCFPQKISSGPAFMIFFYPSISPSASLLPSWPACRSVCRPGGSISVPPLSV